MFYFSVGYGCFTAGTPVDGVGSLVDEAFFVEKDKGKLGSAPVVGVHGFVLGCPVYGASEADDGVPHDANVFVDEALAEFSEFFWRNLCLFDSIVGFSFNFCWQPMAVPSLGKVDVVSAHAFVSGHDVEVGPVEDVSHVEVA